MLPETTVTRIQEDAKARFPIDETYLPAGKEKQILKRLGYNTGATAEATRSMILLEALEKIKEMREHRSSDVYDIITEAIASYNQQTNTKPQDPS